MPCESRGLHNLPNPLRAGQICGVSWVERRNLQNHPVFLQEGPACFPLLGSALHWHLGQWGSLLSSSVFWLSCPLIHGQLLGDRGLTQTALAAQCWEQHSRPCSVALRTQRNFSYGFSCPRFQVNAMIPMHATHISSLSQFYWPFVSSWPARAPEDRARTLLSCFVPGFQYSAWLTCKTQNLKINMLGTLAPSLSTHFQQDAFSSSPLETLRV